MPGEGLSSYIDLLLATYPSARGHLALFKLKESSLKLNIRYPSWIGVCPRLNIRNVAEHGVAEVEKKGET
jgi:hypothetical protein